MHSWEHEGCGLAARSKVSSSYMSMTNVKAEGNHDEASSAHVSYLAAACRVTFLGGAIIHRKSFVGFFVERGMFHWKGENKRAIITFKLPSVRSVSATVCCGVAREYEEQ